jgi:penicillin-binding protein 2
MTAGSIVKEHVFNQLRRKDSNMSTTRMDKRKALLKRKEKDKRIYFTGIFFTFLFVLLICRLYFIQVLNGEEYAARVRRQQIDHIELKKVSGNIIDRNGYSFTSAGEALMLKVIPKAVGFNDDAYDVIEALTGVVKKEFLRSSSEVFTVPVVNFNKALIEAVESDYHPGVLCYNESIRYNDKSLARHVIGYLRKSDGVPMSGIEKALQNYLHPGLESYVNVFSDAANRPLFSLGYQISHPERKCYDVQLTLNYNIQEVLEQTLDQYPGRRHGGIVLNAMNGEILALASRPQFQQYDPGALKTNGMDSSFLSIPMEQYPFGSVFKIIVAAAALDSGRYSESTLFTCTGGIQAGNRWMPCHAHTGGLGTITFREAFAHSCNDTFIRIAQDIGGETIIEMAKRFGLGEEINIELPNAPGLLMKKDEYSGTGIANLAIGQGTIMVTPLQAADMITTIVNNGKRKTLKLVDGVVDSEGNFVQYHPEQNKGSTDTRVISQKTAETLIRFMGDVTEYGTGKNASCALIGGTAGKTGTPQVAGDLKSSNYAWFTGFFPKDKPRYIIVVLSLEEGGAADMAAPVFLDIAKGIWKAAK